MSSIPQEFLSGTADRRWLRLDAPVLGNLSTQQITQEEQTLDTTFDSARSNASVQSDKDDE